jgi:hypothetical protein
MRSPAKLTEKCRSTREQAQLVGQSCACPPTERESDPAESFTGAAASPCIAVYRQTFPRQVCKHAPITTIHPGRAATAAWTYRRGLAGAQLHLDQASLRAQAHQLNFCTAWDHRSSLHSSRSTPGPGSSPKVRQNPNSVASDSLIVRHFLLKRRSKTGADYNIAPTFQTIPPPEPRDRRL